MRSTTYAMLDGVGDDCIQKEVKNNECHAWCFEWVEANLTKVFERYYAFFFCYFVIDSSFSLRDFSAVDFIIFPYKASLQPNIGKYHYGSDCCLINSYIAAICYHVASGTGWPIWVDPVDEESCWLPFWFYIFLFYIFPSTANSSFSSG